MKCPNCSAQAADGAAECPACGLIFAKHQERVKRAAEEGLPPSHPTLPRIDPWTGRVVALVLVVVWLAGFALYYYR
ncbi:MAG: hypothetical protein HYZ74_07765 [Elusimicrobia bacterium]|nr:hypothetical protein [Elusimicrobiota bacterium]